MAYARWSNSNWYVFWHICSGETTEEQALACWWVSSPHTCFSYAELKSASLVDLLRKYRYPAEALAAVEELQKYVDLFLKEVEEEAAINGGKFEEAPL